MIYRQLQNAHLIKDACLNDWVRAYELELSNHHFYFCYHYLVDHYEGQASLSFEILNVEQHFFAGYQNKPIKTLQIEDSRIRVSATSLQEHPDVFHCIKEMTKDVQEQLKLDLIAFEKFGVDADAQEFHDTIRSFISDLAEQFETLNPQVWQQVLAQSEKDMLSEVQPALKSSVIHKI